MESLWKVITVISSNGLYGRKTKAVFVWRHIVSSLCCVANEQYCSLCLDNWYMEWIAYNSCPNIMDEGDCSGTLKGMHLSFWTFSWLRVRLKRCQNPRQLVHTGLQDCRNDAIQTCSAVLVQSFQLPLHLTSGGRQVGDGGRGSSVFPDVDVILIGSITVLLLGPKCRRLGGSSVQQKVLYLTKIKT